MFHFHDRLRVFEQIHTRWRLDFTQKYESVCMYVWDIHTYIHTYIHTCSVAWDIHTYIHTYSLFARRINIDFNWRVLGRIENPEHASTTIYIFIKPSTVKYLQEYGFFQSLEYNKSGTAITDDVCVNTRLALSHNSLWISQARLRSCAGRYIMWQRLDSVGVQSSFLIIVYMAGSNKMISL